MDICHDHMRRGLFNKFVLVGEFYIHYLNTKTLELNTNI